MLRGAAAAGEEEEDDDEGRSLLRDAVINALHAIRIGEARLVALSLSLLLAACRVGGGWASSAHSLRLPFVF